MTSGPSRWSWRRAPCSARSRRPPCAGWPAPGAAPARRATPDTLRNVAKYPGMTPDLDRLLNATSYRAFDIDAGRRILAGSDESGSTQLVEIAPDGTMTALT